MVPTEWWLPQSVVTTNTLHRAGLGWAGVGPRCLAQPGTSTQPRPAQAPGLFCCPQAVHTCVARLGATESGPVNLETMMGPPGGLGIPTKK